jgi:hypothetical protein
MMPLVQNLVAHIDRTDLFASFIAAVNSRETVQGFTHNFYRYPARFSPLVARTAIATFTEPGDAVLDPFMGGGTTLVEARLLGRQGIGTDISSLATFVSQVKTTTLSSNDVVSIRGWAAQLHDKLNLRNPSKRALTWMEQGYQRNISGRQTWPIRKTLELALVEIDDLSTLTQQRLARCVLLRTAQWALDNRRQIPPAKAFRRRFTKDLEEMLAGAADYTVAVNSAELPVQPVTCLHRSAIGLEHDPRLQNIPSPKLILTSPPYPGVHVLYHRWQVQGRKETAAPFWIADSVDGHGAAYYTFGDRRQQNLRSYYEMLRDAYASVASIADRDAWVVQLVAFSDPSWQLPRYLQVMEDAGLVEARFRACTSSADGRLWRSVPNRKWYADQRGSTTSSKEVVLFHRLKKYGAAVGNEKTQYRRVPPTSHSSM